MKAEGLLQGLVYSNPKPLVHPIGCFNEATVVIEGVNTTTLIDTGAQVATINEGLCWNQG